MLTTALYIPASNLRALQKAHSLPCDALIFDLEDGVSPQQKAQARLQLAAAMATPYPQQHRVLRVSHPDSPAFVEDIALAAQSQFTAILLPKITSVAEVVRAEALLQQKGLTQPLWLMIETPQAVAQIEALVTASPRLAVLVMGFNDLALALRLPRAASSSDVSDYAFMRCLFAARMAGLQLLDGVFLGLEDEAGLMAEARRRYQQGADGKTLIHPKQIAPVKAAFAPSEADKTWAQRVVAAWQASHEANQGAGVMNVDGEMIEALHEDLAQRILACL